MDRKEIVLKLSDSLGVKPKYLGPPSFAYEVATGDETYTIDREGGITTLQGSVITLDEILNPQQPEVGLEVEAQTLPIDGLELKLPMDGHTGTSLQNIVNILYSKQHLIMMAFGTEVSFMDATFAEEMSKEGTSSLEEFKATLDKLGTDRCPGITFDFEEKTFTFALMAKGLSPEKVNAFKDLSVLISDQAKKLKRASFKQAQEDNPKYALRTWLIRLGMNGCEYKATRKTLMANLEGSGAYRRVGENSNG